MSKAPNAADKEVGKRIRLHRRERKFTQPQLAHHVGITSQQLQKYESGVNRIAVGKLVEIATALKVEMVAFFDRIPTVEPSNDNQLENPQFDFTHEALLMSTAFMSISKPLLRKRILELVQSVAAKEVEMDEFEAEIERQPAE
ncbi:transcriptional regulator with XRE-family HTH domain [Neorhizobium sp. 2083]|uniref:helix-turn-helix domain-containing protein n=1 Tax=Neorhizobium sp. 2083 TaxID=2817762 RepID=UPI000DDF29E4|nr:helix-turn-helix transcriptional regulator [Neorhizobium sp. 2083]MDR6818143.1 transcriptional regulator with XRE-family HTH domain [Neorhizobium sp. 2083]